ncbi:MAG: peptidylprolyl isomerase [Ruminococcus sp.]|nr:peptidylprolyl isomerase [Ruminococcus sp.]HRR75369.1 peptidylprolyl isomerase [Ruminococcus sp.]
MFRKGLSFTMAACLAGLLVLTGCGDTSDGSSSSKKSSDSSPAAAAEIDENTTGAAESGDAAEAEKTPDAGNESSSDYSYHGGKFIVTLYPDKAPITCENFEKLVSEGFYDGLTFHRVIEGFMAQGGDPLGTGVGGSDEEIKGEFSANGVDNDLSHTRGVISMARSAMPDSASSQFFICYSDDCTFLDGNYAAFGMVTEGMDIIDGFLEVPRSFGSDGDMSSPDEPIVIDKAVMLDPDSDGNPRAEFTMK